MKIEAGKYYRTRDGRKARVLCTDHVKLNYPVAGSIGGELYSWTGEGEFYRGTINIIDLVAEWIDKPELPPGVVLPSWANKAMAMDESGRWHCFSHTPEIYDIEWVFPETETGQFYAIPRDCCPEWRGDWKDSLVVFDTET